MPPASTTGIITSASNPISTEWRTMFAMLSAVPKLRPATPKKTSSATSTASSTVSCRSSIRVLGGRFIAWAQRPFFRFLRPSATTASRMTAPWMALSQYGFTPM